MASAFAGLIGGLLATIVMTVAMRLLGDGGPPPTAMLVAAVGGGDPADYAMPGMALHLVYGVLAGGVFAVATTVPGFDLGSPAVALGLGLVYGIVLLVGGMLFWMRTVIGGGPGPQNRHHLRHCARRLRRRARGRPGGRYRRLARPAAPTARPA